MESGRPDRRFLLLPPWCQPAAALRRSLHRGRESARADLCGARPRRREQPVARGHVAHRALMRGFFILLFLPVAALAHQSSISYSELSPRGREVSATLRFALADLRTQMKLEDSRAPRIPALTRLVLEPFILKAAGVSCALQPGVIAEPDGEDGLALHARWACPQDVEELSVRVGFLELFPPGHAHLSRIEFAPDEVSQRVAQRDEPSFEARRTRSASSAFWRFLLLGVEHIFTGYDHVAFLVGLLLLGGTIGELVKIVTAFTVAHSITLALAALEIVTPHARAIEPLIAASIMFVGLENLWALRRGSARSAIRARCLGMRRGARRSLARQSLAAGALTAELRVHCVHTKMLAHTACGVVIVAARSNHVSRSDGRGLVPHLQAASPAENITRRNDERNRTAGTSRLRGAPGRVGHAGDRGRARVHPRRKDPGVDGCGRRAGGDAALSPARRHCVRGRDGVAEADPGGRAHRDDRVRRLHLATQHRCLGRHAARTDR